RPSALAFFRKMAILVSKSGGVISVINPHSKRERRRSSSVGISFGGRSLEMTICLFSLCNVLKVWKNSSCVDSLDRKSTRLNSSHVKISYAVFCLKKKKKKKNIINSQND